MKQHITLGVVCLARKTYDWKTAGEMWKKLRQDLSQLEQVTLVAPEELVIEVEEAEKAAELLAERRVDAVAIISGTFHLGHLALLIAKQVKKPILLWALPELPYDGGKIRLNSVCGANLNASNLYKGGIRNYRVVVRPDMDQDWLDAIRVRVALSTARVGIIGYRAHGFFNLSTADLALYNQLGVLLDHFEPSGSLAFYFRLSAIPQELPNNLARQFRESVTFSSLAPFSLLALEPCLPFCIL